MYRILFLFYFFAPIFSYSQSQEYYFNNNLQGTNGGGDLTSVLSCSATTGGFSSNIITTTAGLCGTFDTYCFNEGEGFAYPNTGITDEYTINMFFKFNSLSGYSRLIDFSNGTSDTGFYILNDCLNLYPNGNIGTCPFFLPNIYYLLTFVRNATTNFISVYVNGTLFGSYSDVAGTYKLATNSTPIIFFRDDVPVPCEDKPGCVKYISITPNIQNASQVNATWLNVCNIVSPCPTLPTATITPSIPSQNICAGTSTNIQFSGTPNATVTYTVNNGTNQTIVLDATGNATLPTGNLSINTTYDLVSAELGTCFQIQSGTETVTVNPIPTATISGTPAICSGSNTNLNIILTGTQPWSVTYSDGVTAVTATGITTSPFTPAVSPTFMTTYTVTAVSDSNCVGTFSGTETVTVNPIPTATISGTPAICSGSNTNLNIILTGTQPWSVTYSDGVTAVTATGITASPFTPAVSPTFLTTYTVTAVSDSNCVGTFSGTETVTVNPIPTATISGTPAICSGSNTNLNIVLTGTQPWNVTYTDGVTAVTTTGITTSPFTPAVSPTFLTTYTVTAVSDSNCVGTFSGTETITVNPIPTATISGTTAICSGTGTTISFSGTPNATVTYKINAGSNLTLVLDAVGKSTLVTGALTANSSYDLVSVALGTCSQIQIGNATVSINALPTASISGTTAICSGTGTTISFSATPNATVSYKINSGPNQILVLDAAGKAALPTGILIANSSYDLVNVALGTCSQIQTGNATVSINALPTASISGTTAICSGTGTTISFSGTPNATVSYKINSGPNQTLVLDAAGKAALPTGILFANSSYDLVNVALGTCSQTQTENATVSINALPTASISGTTAICSGTGTNITFNGTPNATVTYKINSGPNQTLVLDAAGKAALPTGILIANSSYDLVNVALGTCSQTQTGNATVSINALPTASISGTTAICSGTGTNITFNGTPNATVTYKINAGSNQTIVLDASGTATLATGNLTVLTSYDLVSVLLGTCSQTQTGNATVSINLKPIISSSTGSNFICVEWKTNVLLAGLTLECNSNSANFTFQWQLNNINIPGATSQNYTINSATPGIYKVFTKSISPLGCSNESTEFVVIQSGPASFLNPPFTVSNFFSENQNITAHIEGYGNYEYSIDGNLFQSSNTFNTVSTGTHYITIKDINSDCDEVIIKNITTINYPKFFSPNNDGINDIWTIKDLSKTLKAKIVICDRFGKLIKVIQPSDIGWDGTLNGYNLPATDYWFSINYTEDNQSKIFKSHFSLVR